MIGYHASHEQFSPKDLLDYVQNAEDHGFQSVMSSDHIAPWSVRQGNSGFNWSWLGAALQATENLSYGSLAIPIGLRFHPAVVAQAAATLADMFPDRFRWIAAGSGEAMNETIVGEGWPDKEERNARLLEGVTMIRQLWAGETVTKKEGFIHAEHAKIWSLPKNLPSIYGAALTPETARWIGGWADGLITVRKPPEEMKAMIQAFRDGGGHGKPIILQLQICWAKSEEDALDHAYDQWRSNALSAKQNANLTTPEKFDEATKDIQKEDFRKLLYLSSKAEDHINWIKQYQDMGFQDIYIHNTHRDQKSFIEFFGREVLPHVQN